MFATSQRQCSGFIAMTKSCNENISARYTHRCTASAVSPGFVLKHILAEGAF